MSRLLIPDPGPLFSLAAANLLPLLAKFRVGIADVVRSETINRGRYPNPSTEAQRLLAYYNENAPTIDTFQTQAGMHIAQQRLRDPDYRVPANLGELSIQSLLIDLQLKDPGSHPVVLFEDSWFQSNAPSLAKPCLLLSTQAFLEFAQERQWIASASQARRAIETLRPFADATSVILQSDRRKRSLIAPCRDQSVVRHWGRERTDQMALPSTVSMRVKGSRINSLGRSTRPCPSRSPLHPNSPEMNRLPLSQRDRTAVHPRSPSWARD